MSIDRQRYIREWEPEFRAQCGEYRQGPVQQRPCRDLFCLVLFVLIMASFIWFGIHFVKTDRPAFSLAGLDTKLSVRSTNAPLSHPTSIEWKPLLTIITLMALLTIALSAVYLFLIKKFPRCMIYTTIGVAVLIFVVMAIRAFLVGQWIIGILMIIYLALISCCIWCCIRNSLQATVLVLRLSASFLQSNLSIFLIPVVVSFISFILTSFGVAWALQDLSAVEGGINNTHHVLFVPQFIYYMFITAFLYYVTVFLIASAVGQWYYQRNANCCAGLGNLLCSHLGSLTFASIIITLIKLVQMALDSAQREADNCYVKICICCIQCCVSSIEALIQTLNHYAIIIMSLTGQGFVDSAKTGGIIIFSHPALFGSLGSVSGFIVLSGILFLTILPTVVGVFVTVAMGLGLKEVALTGCFTFIISSIIAVYFLGTLSETISSMFVYYCFDRQLQIYGVRELNPPGFQPYSYEQLVNQNLTGQNPVGIMTAAYPYLSGEVPTGGVGAGIAPSPNPYVPVAAEPMQSYPSAAPSTPLYQPYNSGIKTGYENREYNAPGYRPPSGQPDYQSRTYNQPNNQPSYMPMQNPPGSSINRQPLGGYPQI